MSLDLFLDFSQDLCQFNPALSPPQLPATVLYNLEKKNAEEKTSN